MSVGGEGTILANFRHELGGRGVFDMMIPPEQAPWKAWYPNLLKFAREKFTRLSGGRSREDAAQDVALKIFEKKSALTPDDWSAYTYWVLRNAIIDSLRKGKRKGIMVPLDDRHNNLPDESNLIDRLEEEGEIEYLSDVLLSSLSTDERAFMLWYLSDRESALTPNERQKWVRLLTRLKNLAQKQRLEWRGSVVR